MFMYMCELCDVQLLTFFRYSITIYIYIKLLRIRVCV